MRVFIISLLLVSIIAVQGFAVHATYLPVGSAVEAMNLVGRWRVKFTLTGGCEKNLIFDSRARGSGSFLLLDTGPDNKPIADPLPAVWSELTNDRVSFAGDVELPIGTCCREIGTLTFKGKFISSNSIAGQLVFVTSVDEEESPYKFRSLVGTFTATRVTGN
jgi:hypothetical protein